MKKTKFLLTGVFLFTLIFSDGYSKDLLEKYIVQMEQFTPPEIEDSLLIDLLQKRYGKQNTQELITTGLEDEEGAIRQASLIYIVKNKMKIFSRILVDKISKTSDVTEKKWLIWAFGEVGNPDDVLAMIEYLRNEQNPFILNLIAAAVSKISRESGNITPLLLLAENSKSFYIKSTAIIGLGKIGDPKAIPVVWKQALEHPTKEVRFCSIIALSVLLPKAQDFEEKLTRLKNQFSAAESTYEKLALAYTIQKTAGFNEALYTYMVGYLKYSVLDELAIDLLENLPFKQASDRLEIILTNYPKNMIKPRINNLVMKLKAMR